MAQAELSADLAQRIGAERTAFGQAWYVIRRWPIIPLVVLGALILTGIFANVIAPFNPITAVSDERNLPPVWYKPIVLSVKRTDASPLDLDAIKTLNVRLSDLNRMDEVLSPGTLERIGAENVAQLKAFNIEGLKSREEAEQAFKEAGFIVKIQFPTWNHMLGSDQIGRDLLSRVIHGARVSLVVTAISLTSGMLVGVSMGLVSGYYGGIIDEVIMRITDIWLGLPFILVAIVVVIALGQTLTILLALLALLAWPPFIRNVRGEVLSLKTRDYVSLARVAGASTFRILIWHILPGVINTVIVIATLRVGQLILTEAILSFLGAGIPPPTPAWGAMVADGRTYLNDAWWIAFFPGVCIFLLVMSLNFLGDWMRDRFDPRLRQL